MKRVEWTSRALKDAGRLDRRTRGRIVQAVERLAETGHGDVKRLQGYEPLRYRLRVGRTWRVHVAFDEEAGAVRVLRVLPRGGAYQK